MRCGPGGASSDRRARLRENSSRLHDFGQRFAQRRKLVVRDPGAGFSRAGIFLSPGAKLDAARHFRGRCNRQWSDGRQRLNALLLEQLLDARDRVAFIVQQTLFDDTVIIAQTGWGQTQARSAQGESGFNHHLVKPVTMDRLEELLAGIASARGNSHAAN